MPYFPPPHPAWEHAAPETVGLDPAQTKAAAAYAAEHETP